jgi:nucleoside-diphosphate-sugar epimerase
MNEVITNQPTISVLGSGWLGFPLAKSLLEQDYYVNLSTRNISKFSLLKQAGAKPFYFEIDHINDKMAEFLVANILIINITSKNLISFQSLINYIAQSPIKHVLFISSTSVYKNKNRLVTESDGDESTESILYQIEQSFQKSLDFDITILRLSGLIGYQRHPGRFFTHNKPISNPDAPVNLIHRDDCIGLIIAIIIKGAWGEVFNGCADTHPNRRDFYSYARQLLDAPPPLFTDTTESQYKIVSNDKIKAQIGYQFLYPDLMNIHFKKMVDKNG